MAQQEAVFVEALSTAVAAESSPFWGDVIRQVSRTACSFFFLCNADETQAQDNSREVFVPEFLGKQKTVCGATKLEKDGSNVC